MASRAFGAVASPALQVARGKIGHQDLSRTCRDKGHNHGRFAGAWPRHAVVSYFFPKIVRLRFL
eukprot:20555-Prymnesium_polylepis.1